MREILFKAKRTDNGEWVKGYVVRLTTGEWKIERKCDNPPDCDPMWSKVLITYKVDPSTICQCTGLTDKNRKKIWENDIVRCYADTDDFGNDLFFYYKVVWHEKYHCWWLSEIYVKEDEFLYQYASDDIEVIGNIFDNPELLEGGAD